VYRMFKRKTDQITPQQYTTFRDFLNRVSEYDNKQYALK
jgi:hypothetical protein